MSPQGSERTISRVSCRYRAEILSLRTHTGWSYSQISSKLSIPRSAIRHIIRNPHIPEKPQGRVLSLNTPLRQRLVKRATIDGYHKRLYFLEIAALENIQACKRTLELLKRNHTFYELPYRSLFLQNNIGRIVPFVSGAYSVHIRHGCIIQREGQKKTLYENIS